MADSFRVAHAASFLSLRSSCCVVADFARPFAHEIQIDAVGFKGADCEQATRFLEEALGTVQQKQRRPEFLQRSKTKLQQKVGR